MTLVDSTRQESFSRQRLADEGARVIPSDALQRARGHARLGVESRGDSQTRLKRLVQEGCLKIRLLRPEPDGSLDAVLINTSGGLTGGDQISVEIDVGEGARTTVTTPGCERIYRSLGSEAMVHQCLQVGRCARLDWVPQETILFDQSRLRRRVDVRLAATAEVTVCESILFGRTAMGETVTNGFLSDFWTVERDGRMLFADATRVADPFANTLTSPSALGGFLAVACVVHVGQDLEAKRDALRARFPQNGACVAGASVVGDVLVARIAAASARTLRQALIPALETVREQRPLPRNWLC